MRGVCDQEIAMEFLNSYCSVPPLTVTEAEMYRIFFSDFLMVLKCG